MIKKYIQLALDNDFCFYEENRKFLKSFRINVNEIVLHYKFQWEKEWIRYNLLEIILSDEFITAIVKGIWDKSKEYLPCDYFDELRLWKRKYKWIRFNKKELLFEITIFQAIAIRKKELKPFIKDLFYNL